MNNIRYADDAVLIADSEEKLQRLIDEVDPAGEKLGVVISRRKTDSPVFFFVVVNP